MEVLFFWGVIIVIAVVLLALRPRTLREYERAVLFRLGRFNAVKGPGLIIVPIMYSSEKIDLRLVAMDVPSQDVISQDNVSVKVNAVVYYRVIDPEKAIIKVEKYYDATSQLAQTTLRSVLGKHSLDEMLSERDKLNDDIQKILDKHTDNWGIKVENVEIKHVDVDESMIRAIAQQAEAERSRRAKIIHAEGESQAAENLVKAAKLMGADPRAIQLRYLQTLNSISQDNAKIIVFPMPMDLMEKVTDLMGGTAKEKK